MLHVWLAGNPSKSIVIMSVVGTNLVGPFIFIKYKFNDKYDKLLNITFDTFAIMLNSNALLSPTTRLIIKIIRQLPYTSNITKATIQ